MSFDPLDAFTGETSNCCGARVMIGGICAACKEHCDAEESEERNAKFDYLREEDRAAKVEARFDEMDRRDRAGPRT